MYENLRMATERAAEMAAENTRKMYSDFLRTAHLEQQSKGHHDLKTKIDEANSKIIKNLLSKVDTGFTIYDEERGGSVSDKTIFIDPIDGTNNMLTKKPYFSVSIGAVDNGELVHGVVNAPMMNETYIATKGKPAVCRYKNLEIQLKLSKEIKPESVLFFLDYYTTVPEFVQPFLKLFELMYKNGKITLFNFSSALDICRIADGTVDGGVFIGNMPWDFCGAACILQQAGGKIYNTDGSKFNPYERGIIAVRDDEVMDRLVSMGVLEITRQIPKELLKFP